MSIVTGHPARQIPIWLTQGFRLFFFAAAGWSAAAMTVWIVMLTTGAGLPSRFDPLTWHIHEMLFGFVMAAIAGFLLTAIPNWTRRAPISGALLAVLAGLWLLGRAACLISALFPAPLAITADLSFPVALAAVAAREIVASRNWRNLPIVAPIVLLGVANLLMHLDAAGMAIPAGLGWRIGLAAALVLISVIAGRIVPSFTANWLKRHGETRLPPAPGAVDRLALGALHIGLVLWSIDPQLGGVGEILLVAAALNLWRLARWRGAAAFPEPLLFILHVGYFWLVIGTALLGLAALGSAVPESAAIHALTTGAIGTMILAVMTRATRGHTGRDLMADRPTSAIYALVTAAACFRLAAAFAQALAMPLLVASASLWIAAFALFVIGYAPMLFGRRAGARIA